MASEQALEALGHAISGSIGTATSTVILAPLDLVTTRLKVQRQLEDQKQYDGIIDALRSILKHEGLATFYSGIGADVAKSIFDSFLFFGFYNFLRHRGSRSSGILQEMAFGSLAGAASKAITAPLSNVVARRQMTPSKDGEEETLRQILADMRREGGLKALWAGYSATLVLTLNPSITFLLNRRLAARVIPALEEEDVPVAWVAFSLAALSKSAATAFMYPFQTAKTRLQIPSASSDEEEDVEGEEEIEDKARGPKMKKMKKKTLLSRLFTVFDRTIFGMVLRLMRTEGLRALYDGMEGELLKGFFSHGLTMLTKGFFHRMVIRMWIMSCSSRPLKITG